MKDFSTRIIKKYKQYGNIQSEERYFPQLFRPVWYKLFLGCDWVDIPYYMWGSDPMYGFDTLEGANNAIDQELLKRQPIKVEVESQRIL